MYLFIFRAWHIFIELNKEAIPEGQSTLEKLSSHFLIGSEINEKKSNR